MFSLFPKDENFFELFRRQAVLVRQGCDQLDEMVQKFDRLEERARALKDVEHQGDLVAHELFERLNRTFITPLDREDIHGLASGLDDVLDAVEAIASRIVLFKITNTTPQAAAAHAHRGRVRGADRAGGRAPQGLQGPDALHHRDQPARERGRRALARRRWRTSSTGRTTSST